LTSSIETASRRTPFRLFALGCASAAAALLLGFPGVARADFTTVEGQSFSGRVVDVQQCASLTATIDWGDGTPTSAGAPDGGNADGADGVQGTHTYAEEGTYNGSVSYTCNQFVGARTATFHATVQDAALTASGSDSSGAAGLSMSALVAHLDDANPAGDANDFSAQINWGDGATSAGTVAVAAGGGFDVTGSHTYGTAGSYSVTTTITDVGTATATASSTAQIAQTALPPPSAMLTSPVDGATYTRGQVVNADYSCSPGAGSALKPGVAGCSGPVPSGSPLDTSTVGAHTFVVIATDTDGQSATVMSRYSVTGAGPPPPPGGQARPVAHARAAGVSKTLKGGLWLSGIESTTAVNLRIVDYSWAIDGAPYTPCGQSPIASMTFRSVGQHRVSLRITDSLGSVAISDIYVNAVKSAVNSQSVFDCENPASGGNQPSTADCVKVFAWSIVEVGSRGGRGDCFKLEQLLDTGALTKIHYGAADLAHAASISQLFVYSASITGPVAINGLYVPVPSSKKTFYNSLDSTVGVGNISLFLGPLGSQDVNLNLKVKPAKIPAGGCYSGATMGYHLPTNGVLKGDTKIAGLPIGGSLAVDLLYRSSRITATVSLPNIFKLSNGAPAQGTVCLNADNTNGVTFEGIKIFVPAAMIGPVELKDLSFTYLKTQNVLSGGATVILFPGGPGLNASPPPPDQGFGLKNGQFDHAGLDFIFPISAQPVLYPGVFLSHIGVAIGVNPVRFTGQIGVNAAKVVAIDGDVFLVFASSSQPYDYPTSEGPLAPLSGKTFNTFAMAVAGQAKIAVPSLGEIALANGFLLYEYPSYFEFGGGFDYSYSFLHVNGSINGFVDPSASAFNFEGKLSACVGTVKIKILFIKHTFNLCIAAGGVVSSKGIGVCAPIPVLPFISVTIGYVWGDGPRVSFFSCDFGDFEVPVTRSGDLGLAHAAGPSGINLPARLDAATIRLTGAGGPPDAVVTAPDGTQFSTADSTPSNDIAVIQIAGSNETLIGLRHPHAGRWSIAPAPGSVPITEIAVAKSLPNPNIVASVRRQARRATLRYRLTTAPGRQVTFAERGPGTARMIGTARGDHGTITFTPGDGPAGRRQIVALITEQGTPVRNVVVTTYTAPGLLRVGTPQGVRARRRGSALEVSWSPVPGAAGYATTLSLSDGHSEMLFSRRASITFIGADTRFRGRVTVLALGRNGTRGPLGTALVQPMRVTRHGRP
jgi:hypothetical protein